MDQRKLYWLVWKEGEGSTVRVRTPYIFIGLLQNRNKIQNRAVQTVKIIHSHLFRTVKRCAFDPKALLGVFFNIFQQFCTVISLFCNVVCGSLIESNSKNTFLSHLL